MQCSANIKNGGDIDLKCIDKFVLELPGHAINQILTNSKDVKKSASVMTKN